MKCVISECVQSPSHIQLFASLWTVASQASWSLTIFQSLVKVMPTESAMPSNHLILYCPLLLLLSIFPNIRVFSNESALRIQVAKYWSFNFSINASNEYSGLISFRIDWFDLVVQGTLKRPRGMVRGGRREDEMAGWHHQLNGLEFEWTLGDSEGQGGLWCFSSWVRKESDMTEQLNNK